MLDYRKILKQASDIVGANKLLYVLGLFLILPPTLLSVWQVANPFVNLIIVLWSVYITTALLVMIKSILDKHELSLKKSVVLSSFFASRILSIWLLVEIGILVLAVVLGGPVLYVYGQGLKTGFVVLLVLALLIFIPVIVITSMVNILGPLFVINFNMKVREAIRHGYELLSHFWPSLIGLFFLQIFFEIPALFLPRFMVEWRSGLVVSIISAVVFLIYESWLIVFSQTVWLLAFNDLVKPQKFEDEEPVAAPEII